MDGKKYRTIETLVTILLGLTVYIIWLLGPEIFQLASFGRLIVEVSAVIAAFIIFYLFKRWAKAEDERVIAISQNAARKTVYIFGVTLLVVSIIIRWLGEIYVPPQDYIAGRDVVGTLNIFSISLMLSAIGLWATYLIFYDYYSKKYGDLGDGHEK